VYKFLADALTVSRLLLALVLVWLGETGSAGSLPSAISILVLAWVTDLLDGPLARRDPSPRQTWIGDHDLAVDVSVAVGALGYLTLAGYVSPPSALTYVAVAGLLLAYYRSPALAMAAQALPYAGMLLVGLWDAPLYGALALGWIGLLILITWPRVPRQIVPDFLCGIKALSRTRKEIR
jgi:phosphatidylglycerophosphate synthase